MYISATLEHGNEEAYVLYNSLLHPTLDPNNIISIVRKRMVRMWTNFSKFESVLVNIIH